MPFWTFESGSFATTVLQINALLELSGLVAWSNVHVTYRMKVELTHETAWELKADKKIF